MHKPIATVGLMFLIALTGCKRTSPDPEPQVADATPGDITELRKALKQSQAETLIWKAKAQTTETSKPNDLAKLSDQIVHVWDLDKAFWRDVQLGDYEWTLLEKGVNRGYGPWNAGTIYGKRKGAVEFEGYLIVRDQIAEQTIKEYCKLGKKDDEGNWCH